MINHMAIQYVDIIGDKIPKYTPFNYKLESKNKDSKPFTSELLILLDGKDQPISLKNKKPYIIAMDSTQILSIKPYYDEVIYSDIEDLVDEMDYFENSNNLYSGIFVFFSTQYVDTISFKPDRVIQVLKKIENYWYSYDIYSNMWVLINIKTNILSITLSYMNHRYICIEDLS